MKDYLAKLVADARARYEAMTPAEKERMYREQRRSYCRAEAGFGSDKDEAAMRAAIESGDPECIAEEQFNEALRLAEFDRIWPPEAP